MIAKKLLEIQASIKSLAKDKTAYGYDYLSGDKLLSYIRPLMSARSLLLLPSVTDIRTEVLTYEAYDRKAGGIVKKTEVLYHVFMEMTWTDAEDGETLTIKWAGSGQNAFDKGYGSALTYGERYYLLKTFHLPTDKDDVDYVSTRRDEELEQGYKAQATAKAMTEATFSKFVAAHAAGQRTKDGGDIRAYYIAHYHPDAVDLARFDEAVAEYKINNSI